MTPMTTIHTIGHSTRSIEEFIDLLTAQGIGRVVDIRTVPKSRRHPQYWHDALAASLGEHGIGYTHLAALGGLRKRRPDSPNTAWRNASFQGYADHMLSDEFASGLAELLALAEEEPCAIMCAEAVPWRCHRRLVADALLVCGLTVLEIISAGQPQRHELTPFAAVDGTEVTYPGSDDD